MGYDKVEVVGRGSFGVVTKEKNRNGKLMAIKYIRIKREEESKSDHCSDHCSEAEIGKELSINPSTPPYLLKYYDCKKCKFESYPEIRKILPQENSVSFFSLEMEYCNGGSLQDWLISTTTMQKRNKETAEMYFSQILEGVTFLQKLSIVHGDLKPHNILLHHVKDETIIKIGDFGESFRLTDEDPNSGHRATPLYQEEAIGGVSDSYDVYSLGLIYSIMFMSGVLKFDQDLTPTSYSRELALHNLLGMIKRSGPLKWIRETHPGREQLIRKMLTNKNDRPKAYEVQSMFNEVIRKTSSQSYFKSCPFPGKNPLFKGRVAILNQINTIYNNNVSGGPKFVLLHGIPGTGKKSVAAEFIHLKSESTDFKQFIWFRSDNQKVLKNKYSNLQNELKLKKPKPAKPSSLSRFRFCSEIQNCYVKNWLENHSENSNFLVVYENVQNFDEVKDLIPHKEFPGLVICTTRTNAADWPEYFHKIKVGRLPMKDCTKLIQDSLTLSNPQLINIPKEDAEQLVKQMSFLPTAIGQSLAYIKSRHNKKINTISEYIHFHQTQLAKLDKTELKKLTKFSKTDLEPIYATTQSIINQIKDTSKPAFEWLKVLAYFDSENIPEFFLDGFIQQCGTPEVKDEIISVLNSFSVIDFDNEAQQLEVEGGYQTFSVSRILQEMLQISYQSSFEETIWTINNTLKHSMPNKTNKMLRTFGSVLRIRLATPHLESVLTHLDNHEKLIRNSHSLTSCISSVEEKVRDLMEQKFNIVKGLIKCYTSLGNREKLKGTLQSLISVKEIIYGDNNYIQGTTLMASGKHDLRSVPSEIKERNKKENLKDGISKLEEAEKMLKKCYEENPKNFEIYQCYLYLGEAYEKCSKGRSSPEGFKAEEYYKKSLAILIEVVQRNKQLLDVIGFTLRKIGDLYQYSQEFEIAEQYLLLGFEFYMLQKRPDNSLDLILEDDVVQTTTTEQHTRSKCESKILYEKLETVKNLLQNSLTKNSSQLVTNKVFETTLSKWIENPNNGHGSGILKSLAKVYKNKKDLERLEFTEKIRMKLKMENKGIRPKSIKKTDNNTQFKNLTRSLETATQIQRSEPESFSPIITSPQWSTTTETVQKPESMTSLKDSSKNLVNDAEDKLIFAKSLKADFKLPEAIKQYEEALKILLQHRDKSDLNNAFIYESIGECYSLMGNNTDASKMYKECYTIEKSNPLLLKESNIKFAKLIQKYVRHLPRDKAKKKIELLQESLCILKSFFGEDHNELGFVNEKIGSLYNQLGDYNCAKGHLLEAYRIFKIKLQPGNQNRLSCLEKLCTTFQNLMDIKADTFKREYDEEKQIAQNGGGVIKKVDGKKTIKSIKKYEKTKIRNEERKKGKLLIAEVSKLSNS